MKSTMIQPQRILIAAVFFAAFGLTTAQAQDTTARECVAACSEDFKACVGDAKEAFGGCREAEGCLEARSLAREICRAEEVDEAACEEAKGIARECFSVCREPLKIEIETCLGEGEVCLIDGCGLELRRPARALRSGRIGRRGRPGGRG